MSENINETCVGPASEQAGKASSCVGCPNQSNCSSGAAKQQVDIDAEQVNDRMALIKNKILVLSGKGGVGKSTVSAQLAFSLSLKGFQVGLLDIDICGPSIPRMLGLSGQEVHQSSCGWSPVYVSDTLGVMSIGFMLPNPDDAIIWRGPRKNGLIKQFLCDVDWGKLDYLIIDTPPGTSDEHISIVQHLVAAGRSGLGAVVVTTPQEVAMADVRKELNFCKKTGLPVYGIVENMSEILVPLSDKNLRFLDPESGADATAEVMHKLESVYPELARYLVQFPMLALCDSSTNATYGEKPLSGPARMAQAFDTKHLGTIPMDSALLACGERGQGLLESFPTSLVAKHLSHIIDQIIQICITDIPDAANADKMN